MAWIELHQSLPNSRKTLRLKALLKLRTCQAVGHLCLIWLWALDNLKDGDLTGVSPLELAQVADFNTKRAGEFLEALITAGFIDRDGPSLHIHDWEDYSGRYTEMRKKNSERKRRYRERLRDGDTTGTDPAVTPLQDSTGQNSTVQDMTVPVIPSGGGDGCAGRLSADMRDYLSGRGLLPEEYFGAEPELLNACGLLTDQLFSRFAARKATELDKARVFCAATIQRRNDGGGLECCLDQTFKDLLCYAFEAAAQAGKGGQWSYIEGVLAKLRQRGLKDLRSAELYELDRVGL